MDYIMRIKDLMKIKKINQRELASLIGKTQTTINNYLVRKTKLDVDTLIDISSALSVSPIVLLKDTDYKTIESNNSNVFESESKYSTKIETLQKENELLKSTIKDKEEIINLLKSKK